MATARSINDWQQMMGVRPVEFLHYAGQQAMHFRAQHQSVVLDEIMMSHMSSSAHHVQRTVRADSGDASSYVQIGLQLHGWSRTQQGTRTALARPGDLLIFSTDVDLRVDLSDEMSAILFMLPQRMLGLPEDVFAGQPVRVIPGVAGLGLLMARTLGTIGDDLEALTGRGGARVASSAATLAAAMLLREEEEDESLRVIGFDDICDYIDAHLGEASLTAQGVADAHFIALRTLQYQLQREGTTVSRLIRERRLERARRDIRDAYDTRSIAEVAKSCGFASAAHFSREFKLAYGVSPSDYRRTGDVLNDVTMPTAT